MEDIDRFYELLFEKGEDICWTYDIYGTRVFGRETSRKQRGANFFSINPLTSARLDANVTCFRNILVEFDTLPLPEQLFKLTNAPMSTIVYSGGKSYHGIISLERPCETREEYDDLVRRVYKKLPEADPSTKNPSRLSRAPGAMREGKEQTLVHVGSRVPDEILQIWLGPKNKPRMVYEKLERSQPYRILKGTTQYFLFFGAEDGSWNRELFLATLDMARASYVESEIMERLEAVTGHLDRKDKRTIKSALQTAAKEKT